MCASFYEQWRHVFKLDPDRAISDEVLEAICLSGTDGIMVGGSSGITYDNVADLLARIRRYEVPCALELSDAECGVPGFDGYLIPSVLNASDPAWLIGRQAQAIADYGHLLPWEQVAGEAYLILNGDATAAKVSGANAELDEREAAAYCIAADRLWRVPIVYVEYSGKFGDMQLVKRVKDSLRQARLFYGGGIDGAERARMAAAVADTVIVGNIVYADLDAALATVDAVRDL